MPVTKNNSVKKPRVSKKKKKEEVVVEEVVVEEEVVEDEEEDVVEEDEVVVEEVKTRSRPASVDRESVFADADAIMSLISAEITAIRSGDKPKGIRFLSGLNTKILKLQKHSMRIAKGKAKRSNTANTNSGFLKPVKISKDLDDFTGWSPDELHSRVDVTKYICKYIKDNDLQFPDDKRKIIPDAKLRKLLALKKDTDPIPYYAIQTHIKHHFVK